MKNNLNSPTKIRKFTEELKRNLITHIKKNGPEAILPHNLSSSLLTQVSLCFDLYFEEENPNDKVFEILIFIISIIKGEQLLQQNPKRNRGVEIPVEELVVNLDLYRHYTTFAKFKYIKKLSGFEYTKPTILDIFDPKKLLHINPDSDFLDNAKEIVGTDKTRH